MVSPPSELRRGRTPRLGSNGVASASALNLRGRAVRGAVALSGGNAFAYAFAFAATLVLAHLLTPRQFGQAALAIAVVELLFVATAGSLSMALIRESSNQIAAAFDVSLVLTVAVGLATLGLSSAIAGILWLTSSATLALMIIALAGGRVVLLVGYSYNAQLERELLYTRVSINQFFATVVASALALGLAREGAGVWSLATRDIAVSVLTFALAYFASRFRFGWTFDRSLAKQQLVFGAQMVGSRIGDILFHRLDNLVVGIFSGTAQLGLYNQAYVLTEAGNRIMAPILQQVPFAAYSRLQNQRALTSEVFRTVTYFVVRGSAFLAAIFVAVPSPLLGALFGAPWRSAQIILVLLALYALLQPLFDHMRVLLVANGAVSSVLAARAAQLAFFVPTVILGAVAFGAVGASIAVGIGMLIGTAALIRPSLRLVEFDLNGMLVPVAAAVVASVVGRYAASETTGDWERLGLGVAGATLAYGAVLAALDRRRLRAAVEILRTRAG
ncbi:MAG: oligosaccharide flippase family protein [Gaiellaceae bacterium]